MTKSNVTKQLPFTAEEDSWHSAARVDVGRQEDMFSVINDVDSEHKTEPAQLVI